MPLSTRRLSSRWFARPLILGVAVLLTLFAATGFLGLRYWHERQAANVSIEHSRQVLDTLDRLRANIADLESERRGYLLTFDPAYLKPYGVSDESVRRESEALQTLVADDPLQSLRAAHLALIVSAKLREMDDIDKTARTSGLDAALATIRSMDEIRSQIGQMVDHERFLFVDWQRRADALEQNKTWLISATVVIVTVLAGAALALARLEARRRRTATEENVQLQSDLAERETKIRRLFDSNIIGIVIFDFEGRVIDANDAFLDMVGYSREDLLSGRMRWTDMTPVEWRAVTEQRVADLRAAATRQAFEKEYFRKDGSRVPVLIGSVALEGRRDEGVAFVLDLTERKRADEALRESERRYREAQMELAHANRVATMGQLSASIAHEVSQPITAAVTNASAGLRWLDAQPPDHEEVRQALGCIIQAGNRAGEVIGRIRALIKRTPPRKDGLEINEAILEVIVLTRSEAVKNGVSVQTQLAEGLPLIQGDRVQLQQVILNLIINAVEAMSGSEGSRELLIDTGQAEPDGVLVAVRDTGPGLAPASLERLFEAFYTTKPGGLGMGLSICRSIIEAHGGRLWASANEPRGAVFQFTLPPETAETVPTEARRPHASGRSLQAGSERIRSSAMADVPAAIVFRSERRLRGQLRSPDIDLQISQMGRQGRPRNERRLSGDRSTSGSGAQRHT
jgi:PAS domain S-box-containing protein